MSIMNLFSLEGKTALVTGGTSGIGQAMAMALTEAGADIACVSVAYEEGSKEVEKVATANGRKFKDYICDFSNREDLYKFIEEVKSDFPQVDILINNAGTILRKPATEHPDEYWDRVIEINLNAQFILTREFGKEMVERGQGKIVFTASLLSFQGGITVPGYSASKGGVAQLAKAFANEWASKGVNVNAIAPGYIATNNTKALREDPERSKSILERIPAGRWGLPEDFAGPIVFLASDASNYLNGSVVLIDGGWMGR